MIDSVSRWLVRYRNYMVAFSFVILAIAALGIPKLGFNGDFKAMFGEENTELKILEGIENTYLQADNVIVLIKPAEGDVFERKNLHLIQDLTESLWETPYSIRIDSLTGYNRSHSSDDTFYVNPLIDDIDSLTDADIESIRQYARTDAYIKKGLVSQDELVTSMVVTLALPDDPITRLPAVTELVAHLNALTARVQEENPGLEIHFMGGPSMEAAMVEIVQFDLQRLLPLTVLICFVVLGVLLRSSVSVLGTLFIIVTANTLTMGIAGWMGYDLTPTSMMAPIMVLILAMADSIHVLTQYILYFRQGKSREEAMSKSIASNFMPILLTSITTAIGFLGMNFSESPSFHDFGNITAMGVLFAFLLTMILLPGVVLLFPMTPTDKPLPLTPFMIGFSRLVVKHNKASLWIVGLSLPVICAFIPQNELNDDIVAYFDEGTSFRDSVDFANEHLSGFQYILYSLDSGEESYVNDPDFLNQVDEFSVWLRSQNNVAHVFSYNDIIKNLNKAFNNDDPAFNKVPESRELAAQYLLLYEMSIPAGNDLTRDINASRSSLRLMVSLNTMTNNELTELDARAQQWLRDNAPELETPGGSRSLMFANLGKKIVVSMISGSMFAMILITLVILVGLGSAKYGIISLVPNIFPAAVVYGVWGMLVGEVNQAAAMTFSISIGLVVDDTVHFLSKYMKARKAGKTSEDSIEYAFTTAGSALLVTSVAISSGMAMLMFSSFAPNVTTAVMLVSIVMVALLLDFIFLPPILLLFDSRFVEEPVLVLTGEEASMAQVEGEIEVDPTDMPDGSEVPRDGLKT